MNNMRDMTDNRIPCWYELSWREQPTELIIRIHEDFFENMKNFEPENPNVVATQDTFNFGGFQGDLRENFGFGDGLHYVGITNGFAEYCIPIPKVEVTTDQKCEYCKGTGRQADFPDNNCIYCLGDGKDLEYHWEKTNAICASLSLLFSTLDTAGANTTCPLAQLLTISTAFAPDNADIWGIFGVDLCMLLFHRNDNIPEMELAMMTAYGEMLGLRHQTQRNFRASLANSYGCLNITIPGDACGIYPSFPESIKKGHGYEFYCHKTDNSVQQLTLLVGLAALHDLARDRLKK